MSPPSGDVLAVLCAAAFSADAATKCAARFLGIASMNSGVSFSLLAESPRAALALSIAAAAWVAVICAISPRARPGAALMLSGICGNIVDRIYLGHVVDWIPIPFVGLTVDLADIWICVGALIAACSSLLFIHPLEER